MMGARFVWSRSERRRYAPAREQLHGPLVLQPSQFQANRPAYNGGEGWIEGVLKPGGQVPQNPAPPIKCVLCEDRAGCGLENVKHPPLQYTVHMTKPKVFVTRLLPEKGLHIVQESCDADVWPNELPPSREELLSHMRGKDGLLSLLTDAIDEAVMDATPHLRVVSNCAVGVDNIDLAAATKRKIPVGNTPDVLTDATADMAFALLLACARRIVEGNNYVRAGKWTTWNLQLLLGSDLVNATLGIIGFGRIGKAVARRAQGFGMLINHYDPYNQTDIVNQVNSLETLLQNSDFVSIHVPLTQETHHMMDRQALRKMKRNAILINTSRGPIIDHDALYEALISGWIQAAGLDVTEPEPIQVDHPLLSLENCIIVPHLGSASRWTRDQMAILAANNLVAGLMGKRLPHCVNPQVYDQVVIR
jgi:glyoxylate reductase